MLPHARVTPVKNPIGSTFATHVLKGSGIRVTGYGLRVMSYEFGVRGLGLWVRCCLFRV
jgi:hypothetical protein